MNKTYNPACDPGFLEENPDEHGTRSERSNTMSDKDEQMDAAIADYDNFVGGISGKETNALMFGYSAAKEASDLATAAWVEIRSEDDLPPNGWYLVMNQESIQVAQMHNGTWYDQAEDDFIDSYVDAWRPLPAPFTPPKGEK